MGDRNIVVDGVDESNRDQFGENDIFFECPRCNKSMAIAKGGIGMSVECMSCGLEMIVPGPDAEPRGALVEDEAESVQDGDKSEQEQNEHSENYHLTREKRDLLFEEIAAIQRSLDRLVATLESLSE